MRMIRCLLTLAALALAGSAAAQWTPETTTDVVVAGNANSQSEPVVASSLWGGTIVAWREYVGGDYLLYAQRLDLDGVPQWGAGGIALTTELDCADLVIDGDFNGGAYIAWASNTSPSGSTFDIRIQHVDIDGNVLGPPEGAVICGADYAQRDPVIYATGQGAIVAWRDNRAWYHDRIYAQRVDGACMPLWTGGGVLVSHATGWNRYPKIAGTGNGDVVVVWHNDDLLRANLLVEADGSTPWGYSGVLAVDEVGSHADWDIAPDGELGILLVFERGNHKYVQRIAADGTHPWADDLAVATAANTYEVAMTATEDDACIVAWRDGRDGYSVWAQRVTPDGTAHWAADGVRLSSPSTSSGPIDICWNGDLGEPGVVFVAWKEIVGLKVQRLGADGVPDWDAGGVIVSTGTGGYFDLNMVKDIDDGVVLSYRAGPGNNDIHAEHVHADGSLGTGLPSSADTPGHGAGLSLRAHPNPFNPRTTVEYAIPAEGPVRMTVVDARGRQVRTLIEGWMAPGRHTAIWDGRNDDGRPLASGVYYCCLEAAGTARIGKMVLLK